VAVTCRLPSPCEPAGGVSAVLAERLAETMTAAPRRGARGDHVQDQAADCTRKIRWRARSVFRQHALLDAGYGHDSKLRAVSLTLESAMWPAFSRRCWCGSRAAGRAGHRKRGTVTRRYDLVKDLASDCGRALGAQSNGGGQQ